MGLDITTDTNGDGLDTDPIVVPSPYDRPTKEILMDLIYQSNKYRAPLEHIQFGVPEVLDIYPSITTDENTFVPTVVHEFYDDRFDGRNGFMYRRISMTELVDDTSVTFDVPQFPIRMSELLPHLNKKFHVQLTLDDIQDTLITSPSGFVLRANKYSLVWIDQREFWPGGYVPIVQRLLEDNTPRALENSGARLLEDEVI